jgi:hypothetical protein
VLHGIVPLAQNASNNIFPKVAETIAGRAFSEDVVLIYFWLDPKVTKGQGSRKKAKNLLSKLK